MPQVTPLLPITIDLTEEDKAPYFLWDEPTSVRQLREILCTADPELKRYYTAKILREARYDDVWKFLSLQEVSAEWENLRPILGRQRAFWEFLFSVWKRHGIVL